MKTNALTLAVAVIIGAVFGAIATRIADDVTAPTIRPVGEHAGLKNLLVNLNGQSYPKPDTYGQILHTASHFLIGAVVIFLVLCALETNGILRRPLPRRRRS